jgi:surfactin synthase thioesterase subunit
MADSDLWIRRFHPATGARQRLVCFAHAGGAASYFHPVSAALQPGIEVLAVQYPGRQDRRTEPMIADIPRLAEHVAEALWPWRETPLAFFGHSMGALVAFETARLLEKAGAPPLTALIASGRRAPGTWRHETVHQRDDDGVIAELRALNGTDTAVFDDEELLRMVMPAIRNDYRAVETYPVTRDATVSCPVTAFVGDRDPRVTLDEARAWADHTTGGFSLEVFPGGHFYLVDRRTEVLERIGALLGVTRAAGR